MAPVFVGASCPNSAANDPEDKGDNEFKFLVSTYDGPNRLLRSHAYQNVVIKCFFDKHFSN